jgi:hypothetical protein
MRRWRSENRGDGKDRCGIRGDEPQFLFPGQSQLIVCSFPYVEDWVRYTRQVRVIKCRKFLTPERQIRHSLRKRAKPLTSLKASLFSASPLCAPP